MSTRCESVAGMDSVCHERAQPGLATGSTAGALAGTNVSAVLLTMMDTVLDWMVISRQRRQLRTRAYDACFLSDVGLSTADVLQEAGKPFWKS